MELIILILTYFKLLKWRIRYTPEYIFSGTDIYAFKFGNYFIKLNKNEYEYHSRSSIIIDNPKKRKRYYFRNDKLNIKILIILKNRNIAREYIKSNTLEFTNDITKKRRCKIKLLKRELIIID